MNKGDVVQLKSGGPKMTVENVGRDATGDEYVLCSWFNGTDRKQATFEPNALEMAEAPSVGAAVVSASKRGW
jgi:uncharacterized protein YodC (DUF2158 family)